jgi:ParB-like chromosome segregation protein Spo0J
MRCRLDPRVWVQGSRSFTDEENVIIVGHTRWKAAQQLGLKRVPVHIAEG